MKTEEARWFRLRDLFDQVADMPVEKRDAFIRENCGDDQELRDELFALLESDVGRVEPDKDKLRGPLTGAIGAAVDETTRTRREEMLGSTIGPYRLASILGHGGVGTVYLGERIDRQYSAQVAIKLVEAAAMNAEIARRFKAERQILASLNHQYIARLIDAGETEEEGYPYLVMEYVHGEPIDRYCDRVRLSVEQRVELILKVCSAVQYAHQNLVVHRDLKPGNILITPDGTPKLLDFGIAKLLDTGDAAAAMALTRMNDRLLTPEYASPEQILGQTITTVSDVYSLGVVLFELLTGLRPYKISTSSQLELERTICVVDSARASTIVRQAISGIAKPASEATPTRDIHKIAEARQITPMRLRSRLNGDLDSILARALRKEAIYRYNSVEQFANDLRRHLAREPVLARQGNWAYYAQRFVRRHTLGVAAGAAFITLITAALIVVSLQSKRISHERDTANQEKQTSEAVADFMVNVFAAADPFTVQDKQVTATELLDKATQRIESNLNQQPLVRARLLGAMGRTYSLQGQVDKGIKLINESLQVRQRLGTPNDPSLAPALIDLAKAHLLKDDYKGAEKPLREATKLLESANLTNTSDYAFAILRSAELENMRGNLPRTFALYQKSLTLFRRIYGDRNSETAMVLFSYGTAKLWSGEDSEAEKYVRESLDIYKDTKADTDPNRISAESILGVILLYENKINQAEPLLVHSLAVTRKVFGERSTWLLARLRDMVDLYRIKGDLLRAKKYANELLTRSLSILGKDDYRTAQAHETLGIVEWRLHELKDAESELKTALAIYEQSLPADHIFATASEHFLAEVFLAENRPHDAMRQLSIVLARLKRIDAPTWRIARSENTLGAALVMVGNSKSARSFLERSTKILEEAQGVAPDTVALARQRLSAFLSQQTALSRAH